MAEESKKVREVAISDKNTLQKIRLIVNLLTPDNLDKKFGELRGYMFGSLKLPEEEGYDKEMDIMAENGMNDENLRIVVSQIFKKAQNEKEYCVFYGDLCEKIIRLECLLKGMKATFKTVKNS